VVYYGTAMILKSRPSPLMAPPFALSDYVF